MDKKTLYIAIFAVGIVVLFIIEPFAIGMLQSAGSRSAAGAGDGGNSSAVSFTGNAVANITIVRYEPYLVVSGNASGIEKVKDMLVSSGVATYAVWSGDNLVVSLKSSKDVPSAALEFEDVNATVTATAYLATSDIVRVSDTSGKSVDAQGTSISMQIRPVYDEGSTHEAQFAARVDDGQVTGMGSVTIMPLAVRGVMVEARLSLQPSATYMLGVAFKDRAAARPLVLAANATYKERSFAYVANASKEALDAALAGKSYVTGTQPGIVSVDNNFTDSETLGLALLQKGYAAVFPDSVATFANDSANGSAQALLGELRAQNMSAEISEAWTARIMLPSVLENGGKQYIGSANGIELLIEGAGAPKENVTAMNVSVDFEAAGSRIMRITAVNPV
ncbi:MAG: hypothetical protein NTX79_06975 [Candidatus Micrarchaeota archaeon]|nr:hypothetical protein [Candidatus Micrarchaeota archaeon]